MNVLWRTITIIAILLAVCFVAEAVREVVVYSSYTKQLEGAQDQIDVGITRKQVESILPAPDWISKDNAEETWHWEASEHQGWLFRRTGLSTVKGHYSLTIRFNGQGNVARVWSGVN
jgi:hypothetical protein